MACVCAELSSGKAVLAFHNSCLAYFRGVINGTSGLFEQQVILYQSKSKHLRDESIMRINKSQCNVINQIFGIIITRFKAFCYSFRCKDGCILHMLCKDGGLFTLSKYSAGSVYSWLVTEQIHCKQRHQPPNSVFRPRDLQGL